MFFVRHLTNRLYHQCLLITTSVHVCIVCINHSVHVNQTHYNTVTEYIS